MLFLFRPSPIPFQVCCLFQPACLHNPLCYHCKSDVAQWCTYIKWIFSMNAIFRLLCYSMESIYLGKKPVVSPSVIQPIIKQCVCFVLFACVRNKTYSILLIIPYQGADHAVVVALCSVYLYSTDVIQAHYNALTSSSNQFARGMSPVSRYETADSWIVVEHRSLSVNAILLRRMRNWWLTTGGVSNVWCTDTDIG